MKKAILVALFVAASCLGAYAAPADNTASQYKPTTGSNVEGVVIQQSSDGYNASPINSSHPLPVTTAGGSEVGSNQVTTTVAQTVTASSAYSTGNAVGGLVTIANAGRIAAGTGLLQSVTINSKSVQSARIDVVLFRANPTASTCTDKTAFSVAAADFDKVFGVAHVTDWTVLGTPSVGQAQNLAMPYSIASGTSLYACLVVRGTPTFASTSDISFSARMIRN